MPLPTRTKELIGSCIAVDGSILSLMGALVNNLQLNHLLAMQVWALSNPLFLAYFVGNDKGYWNGQHISKRALIVTYLVFTVSNGIGLMIS